MSVESRGALQELNLLFGLSEPGSQFGGGEHHLSGVGAVYVFDALHTLEGEPELLDCPGRVVECQVDFCQNHTGLSQGFLISRVTEDFDGVFAEHFGARYLSALLINRRHVGEYLPFTIGVLHVLAETVSFLQLSQRLFEVFLADKGLRVFAQLLYGFDAAGGFLTFSELENLVQHFLVAHLLGWSRRCTEGDTNSGCQQQDGGTTGEYVFIEHESFFYP